MLLSELWESRYRASDSMSDARRFSVVLCTRNRASLLRDALESIRTVDYPSGDFELVLVDNASSDTTPDVVARFCRDVPFPVRSVREEKLGLSAARNRGIREARGRYLFFTDDDQLLDPQVLREHRRVSEKYGARVVQGAIALHFVEKKPPWLHGKLAAVLGETGDLPEGPAEIELYGGNLLLRRDLFDEMAAFREDLGKGQSGYSEDTELTQRLGTKGERIVYAPTARIYHVIGPDRATPAFLRRNSFDKGRSYALMLGKPERFPGFAARTLRHAVSHMAKSAASRLAGDRNRSVVAQVDAAYELGRLMAYIERLRRGGVFRRRPVQTGEVSLR